MSVLRFGVGAAAGVVLAREWQTRRSAERLAAALLETLLNAIDATDAQTGAHVRRVARYALLLADAADLDLHAQRSVERVALFHDIGKISEALFDIVHDERELTPEERRAIATHPERGAEVLTPLRSFYPDLPEGVLSHHERWDGTGYPRGLKREDIPYAARIVAIADTFDAVAHSRPYRSGRGREAGADVIQQGRGTQFDPELVDLFLCPPVFEAIRVVPDGLEPPRPRRAERRVRHVEGAPDVTFRWRSEGPVQRARGQESQESH
jgi:HD-GYP domain-containing protein (c-di-GMP phosphodiesterase class II)